MKNLYKQLLLDHYHSSNYRGTLDNPHFASETHNPSCGDVVRIAGRIEDGKISQIRFEGKGCVISQAAASLLCEQLTGRPAEYLLQLSPQTMTDLIGIELGPVRLKCALLALDAAQEAIRNYTKE